MPHRHLRPWLIVLLLACWSPVGSGAMAQSPSPAASSAQGELVEAVLQGALDDPAAVAAGEAGHRRAEREALGVTGIDPELPAIMDQLDTIAAEILGGYLAEPPFPTEPAASPAPSPSPGEAGRGRPQAMLQVGLNLTFGMAAAASEAFIKGWTPAPGSMTLPGRPGTTSGTFESGGRFTSYTTTLTDTLHVEDGTIRLAYEFSMHSEVLDSVTNATVASIDDRGRYAISINPCPTDGGRVDTVVEAESDVTVRRPGGGSTSVQERATSQGVTSVNDQAEIGSTVTDLAARRTTTGSGASDVGFSVRYGADGAPATTLTQDDGSEADLQATARGAAASALASVDRSVSAARSVWRSRCLTLVPDPAGREVFPGSETTIGVTVRHKVEDRDIEVPFRATLDGTESIDPSDEPQDAPADVTYRAGLEPGVEARVTLTSTSDRGRVERTETYRTGPRLLVDIEGDVDASLGGAVSTYTVTGRGLRVSFGPGDPPSVHLDGEVRIRGRTSGPPGCRSNHSGSVRVHPDASARLRLDGEVPRLAVLLVIADPSATVRVRARCPGGSSTSPFPAAALLGVWALARDPVVVDLPNGTATVRVARSGPTPKQTWTVSVRPAEGG
jgi:hypothetical protein